MQKKKLARMGMVASTMAAVAVGIAASPASAASTGCDSGTNLSCTSSSIPANGKHEVCFGGKHSALSYWGRAELWDADSGVIVASIATNGWRWQDKCQGGLYGQHYYLRGTGALFRGEAWN
ncbi:hypothetical protein [Streptomyces sp. NPDC090445]|uniref:hypothetical protein n=1 Tax=Streptomyces sp. NPDC090445 TaxID=3365963 RepID=UPI00382BE10C